MSIDSGVRTIERGEIAELAAAVSGPVFLPDDEAYAAECAIYNLNLVLEPAVVVGATGEADVQAAVRFATEHGLSVAIKNTGHNVARAARGALLINPRRMDGLTVDAERRTVRIEPGVRWGQAIQELSAFGLAPMNGSSPSVGAIGYSIGGGHSIAWSRSKGYAADHIQSLDVVTADGVLRHAAAESEPELYWALRGGGGNFGVVTAIDCDVFPQERIYGGASWFPIERVPDVLPAWREWVESLPEEASTSVAVQRLPPLPELPPPLQGASVVALRFTHLGSEAEGEQLLAPMRAVAPSLFDLVAEMPYTSIGTVHMDPPEPIPYWDRATMFAELPTEAVDAFAALTGPESQCPLINVEIRYLGGAMDREPDVPNAVATRGLPFVLFAFGAGGPPEEELMQGYLDKLIQGLEPWSAPRRLPNFMCAVEAGDPEFLRAAYGDERYDRLVRVKKAYDAQNVFQNNYNIQPA
jgi:FAD binding domain/Berberine and berberine like